MNPFDRRDLLRLFGTTGAGAVLTNSVGCSDPAPTAPDAAMDASADAAADVAPDVDTGPREGFIHGIASGDPLPEGVILWTRITPPAPAPATVMVTWEVSTTREFTAVARMGTFMTSAARDYTVKVDVTGLEPARTYYFRFRALSFTSPVGRTKTAPRGANTRARFVMCSCSNYAHGYFHGYRNIARRDDLDAVIHLGDYIYEYGNYQYGSVRLLDPATEIVSLDDYRRRYRHYRKDPDLQAAHAMHPFITIWDDHEFANDAWRDGAQNHQMDEGPWAARRAAATQAYMEWMPIREQMGGQIYRKLAYGDLVDLILLDTRVWGRDLQGNNETAANEPNRQLLGDMQERWFFEQVTTSRARWKLVGQQVMMGQWVFVLNGDQWDGYRAARARFFNLLRSMRVNNVAVLTGDIHSSWAFDLTETPTMPATYDGATGRGSLAVEFVTPAITSPGFPASLFGALMDQIRMLSHLKYVDSDRRGYVVLDVTPERLQGQWYHLADVTNPMGFTETLAATFATRDGRNHLERVTTP